MIKLITAQLMLVILTMSGCTTKISTCPSFPKLTVDQIKSIQELHDKDVDSWMVGSFKLQKKLEMCRD